jgi:hypothetical protein
MTTAIVDQQQERGLCYRRHEQIRVAVVVDIAPPRAVAMHGQRRQTRRRTPINERAVPLVEEE